MIKLTQVQCESCDANTTKLCTSKIESLLLEVGEWDLIEESGIQKLKCIFNTTNYEKSISFTNEIAQLAESANHHPLLIVEYSTVTVVWWSHKIKGLHKNDFIMAAKTSELF